MADADWASGRRRRWSASRIGAALLLHVLVLAALSLAIDRVRLPRRAGERVTTLVDVTLHVAPPRPAQPHPLPPPSHARERPPAPATVRAPPAAPTREDRATTIAPVPTQPEPLAITIPPPASAPLPGRSFLDSAATRQAIRDVARGTLQTRARELTQEDPASELVAADGTHVGDTRHVTPTAAQRLQQGVAGAGKGDCGKGEYVGAGMGLLSLPFLVANEAMGKCSPH